MDGIDAAVAAGLKVKINTVALKGVNDDELHELVAWCGERGFDLTFIEVMPMGDLGNEDRLDQFWSLRALRRDLEARWTLTDTAERTGGPARYARVAETGGRIGFITPLTHNFCESCNRVRLTCTGQLYHVPGPGGRGGPARRAARASGRRRAAGRRDRRGHRPQASRPRLRLFAADRARPGVAAHEPHRRLRPERETGSTVSRR